MQNNLKSGRKLYERKNIEKNKLNKNQKMHIYFFIYAMLGWILERVFCLVTLREFTKRGFLYGLWCPMYGFVAVTMIQILKKV